VGNDEYRYMFGLEFEIAVDVDLKSIKFDELHALLHDSKGILTFFYPSEMSQIPTKVYFSRTTGKIEYKVRESFAQLLNRVESSWTPQPTNEVLNSTIWYLGPKGVGISYNLAALTLYWKMKFMEGKSQRRVVFIPGYRVG
jgi:hypothetical protein